jgi:hypothetical protein
MIVSITGIHADGTELSFHLLSTTLTEALQTALDHCRKSGKISAALLDELHKLKIYWQMIIDEQLELDVKD